ncbi:hypothetical protein COCCADRAFT_31568 [Bipolaris zeicola 26-R-13]|uniref:NAD(P)-binding protein n=1 Tax=Cochliobolus carbonum (strain 26-R-13) TaxID=930089 RepID=W6Y628_COCC2|nr:uncharacterized protein COCCADRAFT_31568 [Bipolaris zeicola 26-R-13]EUC26711.1 hypothetical protein COCCADRAFT_31568 [Bipolaris zeicola 26-R-13]
MISLVQGVALVTGGGRGLGNAVATSFAQHGCQKIVILDVLPNDIMETAKGELEKLGVEVLTLDCDVSDEAAVQQAVQAVVDKFGRIDFAVNCAGIIGPHQTTDSMDIDAFNKTIRINTIGVLTCMKYQIQQMKCQEPIKLAHRDSSQRGAIVNFASVNSILGSHSIGAYATSKHAVLGLTKTAALENRDKQIRINCLSPGYIWSAIAEQTIKRIPESVAKWNDSQMRQGRTCYADEIGDATVALCSPLLSIVNAHNLVCDNGFTQTADRG